MQVKHEFIEIYDADLKKYLEEAGINIETKSIYTCFTLLQDSDDWVRFREAFPEIQPHYSNYVYTEEEMENAQWYTIESTNWKIECAYMEETFSTSCEYSSKVGDRNETINIGYHITQVAPFYLSKPIKWGKNYFYSNMYGGKRTIFCSDKAKAIMENAGLKGAVFSPVINHNSGIVYDNSFQFDSCNIISDDDIRFYGPAKLWKCPLCGKSKYLTSALTQIVVNKSILGNSDFYKTNDVHTFLHYSSYPEPFWIISKKAYNTIKAYGMDRSMHIMPLMTF